MTRWTLGAVAIALLAIQLIPYGRDHDNPPVASEARWDSPETRILAARACFDCHSHETRWPWYSNIAPMSWLVQRDVEEGREALNWSTSSGRETEESAETVREGFMPPGYYMIVHPGARLDDQEKEALIRGLAATFGDH